MKLIGKQANIQTLRKISSLFQTTSLEIDELLAKVMDAAKLLSNRLSISCITVPTSAATCAGWTALSNIYTAQGAFIKDVVLNSCPNVLIFDHLFVQTASPKTLASGIADAIAKWYESSVSSSSSDDGIVQQAVQMDPNGYSKLVRY